MAEDPIKLLATRAERYPQPTEADIAQGATRAALAAIPFVGGSITEVLSLVLAPAVTRRRDEWLKELADALDQLESKIAGFKVENLAENEAFVSATIQATRIAMGTHQREKRDYLRNALLHVAAGDAPEEELQQIFLRFVDEFTATHVKILELLSNVTDILRKKGVNTKGITNYRTAIESMFPELRSQKDFVRLVLMDLINRGLSTVKDPEESFLGNPVVTGHGQAFLAFVLRPGSR